MKVLVPERVIMYDPIFSESKSYTEKVYAIESKVIKLSAGDELQLYVNAGHPFTDDMKDPKGMDNEGSPKVYV